MILLLAPCLLFGVNKGTNDKGGSVNVEFDVTIRAGVIDTLAAGIDTLSILGASDTLYTRYYKNWGTDAWVQFAMGGGTTQSFKIILQSCNLGQNTMSDSFFVHRMWINFTGTGDDSCSVKTVSTVIEQEGITIPILLPGAVLGDYFRFYIVSSATQSGNTKFNWIHLTRKK